MTPLFWRCVCVCVCGSGDSSRRLLAELSVGEDIVMMIGIFCVIPGRVLYQFLEEFINSLQYSEWKVHHKTSTFEDEEFCKATYFVIRTLFPWYTNYFWREMCKALAPTAVIDKWSLSRGVTAGIESRRTCVWILLCSFNFSFLRHGLCGNFKILRHSPGAFLCRCHWNCISTMQSLNFIYLQRCVDGYISFIELDQYVFPCSFHLFADSQVVHTPSQN